MMTASCAIISTLCQRMGMLLQSLISTNIHGSRSCSMQVVCSVELGELCLHSLQRIVNRLRLFAHAFAPVRSLVFQLCDARVLAFFQTPGVYGRESSGLLGRKRCDLEVLDSRDRDDVVVAGVAGSCGAGVDCHEVEDRACGEQGAFEGLRLGSGGGELDAGGTRVSSCIALRLALSRLTKAEIIM